MKHLKRKVLGVLLALAMVITMLPAAVSANDRGVYPVISVGRAVLTDSGQWVDCISGELTTAPEGVSYQGTIEKGTLTLKNAAIYGDNNSGIYEGIDSDVEDLTINLIGENTIGALENTYYGIQVQYKLTIKGEGSLTVTSSGSGIATGNDLTISGAKVTVKESFSPLQVHGNFTAFGDGTRVEAKVCDDPNNPYGPRSIATGCPAVIANDISYPGLLLTKPKNGTVREMENDPFIVKESSTAQTIYDGDTPASHVIIEAPQKKADFPDKKAVTGGVIMARMAAKGKNALTFSWSAVAGADGYDIYLARGRKSSYKKIASLQGSSCVRYTHKRLKKKTAYRAYVRAYILSGGKKQYISKSPKITAYTSGVSGKYTNAKSIKLKKANVTLGKDKTYKIKASVRQLKKGKKLMPKSFARKFRYLSTNKAVATVSSSGRIKGRGKGSCKIYVFAHNGVWKTVKVKVK